MRLRYILDGETEVAEITRMFHKGQSGFFVRADGIILKLSPISKEAWLRLVGDMFVDGSLSLSLTGDMSLTIYGNCVPSGI